MSSSTSTSQTAPSRADLALARLPQMGPNNLPADRHGRQLGTFFINMISENPLLVLIFIAVLLFLLFSNMNFENLFHVFVFIAVLLFFNSRHSDKLGPFGLSITFLATMTICFVIAPWIRARNEAQQTILATLIARLGSTRNSVSEELLIRQISAINSSNSETTMLLLVFLGVGFGIVAFFATLFQL